MRQSFAIGIGGAAGQGVATPGDIFAKIFRPPWAASERLQRLTNPSFVAANTFLTIRTGPDKITNMGDRIDLLIPLKTRTRWTGTLGLLTRGSLYLQCR